MTHTNFVEVWQAQAELQRQYSTALLEDGEAVLGLLRALSDEVQEAICLLPNRKHWGKIGHAQGLEQAKQGNLLEELADCQLFLQAVCIRAGYSAEDLLSACSVKQEVNRMRADHGISAT